MPSKNQTQETRLDELVKEHGLVHQIDVPRDDTGENWATCYLVKPNRQIMGRVINLMAQGKPYEAGGVVLNSCWIEGDKEILEDDDMYLSAINSLSDLITIRNGQIKKKSANGPKR